MRRVVINMGSEKKDFLISQAKMAGKNMAQFIADLSAQDNLQERQERQIKRHNEALYKERQEKDAPAGLTILFLCAVPTLGFSGLH